MLRQVQKEKADKTSDNIANQMFLIFLFVASRIKNEKSAFAVNVACVALFYNN